MKKQYFSFIFIVSLCVMYVFRDVRVGLDGCAYAYCVRQLINGAYREVFSWSHPLHVPLLTFFYLIVNFFHSSDVLSVYQLMDILLGAFGLSLLASLAFKLTESYYSATIAWLMCFLSWGYWNQAVTADEKMSGIFFVIILLYLAHDYLCTEKQFSKTKFIYKSFFFGSVFALSFLSHVSAVLVIPCLLFLIVKQRKYAFAVSAALFSCAFLISSYLWFMYLENIHTFSDTAGYFASGLSRYSVFTGFTYEHSLIQTYAQGLTKLFFAVFREDSMLRAAIIALVTAVFILNVFYIVWKRRKDEKIIYTGIFLITTLLFGFTYAPDNYSSYMLFIIPVSLICALYYRKFRLFTVINIFLLIMAVHNIPRFVSHSIFFAKSVEKEYVMTIKNRLEPADRLIVMTSASSNTITVARIHRYFNPGQKYIYFHNFIADINKPAYKLLAANHRLYIEGICFEDRHNQTKDTFAGNPVYTGISKYIKLTREIDYSGYSDLLHRRYKHVYAVEYR